LLIGWQFWRKNANHHEKSIFTTDLYVSQQADDTGDRMEMHSGGMDRVLPYLAESVPSEIRIGEGKGEERNGMERGRIRR